MEDKFRYGSKTNLMERIVRDYFQMLMRHDDKLAQEVNLSMKDIRNVIKELSNRIWFSLFFSETLHIWCRKFRRALLQLKDYVAILCSATLFKPPQVVDLSTSGFNRTCKISFTIHGLTWLFVGEFFFFFNLNLLIWFEILLLDC